MVAFSSDNARVSKTQNTSLAAVERSVHDMSSRASNRCLMACSRVGSVSEWGIARGVPSQLVHLVLSFRMSTISFSHETIAITLW